MTYYVVRAQVETHTFITSQGKQRRIVCRNSECQEAPDHYLVYDNLHDAIRVANGDDIINEVTIASDARMHPKSKHHIDSLMQDSRKIDLYSVHYAAVKFGKDVDYSSLKRRQNAGPAPLEGSHREDNMEEAEKSPPSKLHKAAYIASMLAMAGTTWKAYGTRSFLFSAAVVATWTYRERLKNTGKIIGNTLKKATQLAIGCCKKRASEEELALPQPAQRESESVRLAREAVLQDMEDNPNNPLMLSLQQQFRDNWGKTAIQWGLDPNTYMGHPLEANPERRMVVRK